MKRIPIALLLALFICLFSACGERYPEIMLTYGDKEATITGTPDSVTTRSLFGETLTREYGWASDPEPIMISLPEREVVTANIKFSCEDITFTVHAVYPDGGTAEIADQSFLLEPGAYYRVTGVFQDGRYTYAMTFNEIQVEDSEESEALKAGISENARWDYVAKLYYHGEVYRNTDNRVAELPEGYVLLGQTHETDAWDECDGEEYWATFSGDVYGKDGMVAVYATIPWETEYIQFVPETIWSPESVEYDITWGTYYFRDNIVASETNGLAGCYFDFPWAVEEDLTQQLSKIELPVPPEYDVTSCDGRYLTDGSLFSVEIVFSGSVLPDENPKKIYLRLYPEKPEDLAWARAHVMNYDRVTATEVSGVTIYGDGTDTSVKKVLEFIGVDGYFCQIEGMNASAEDMVSVLPYYLENTPDFNAFALISPTKVIDAVFYFRDNETQSGHIAVWTEHRDVDWVNLSNQTDNYLTEGAIPEINGFSSFDCWARYDEEGLYELQFDWATPNQENYQSLVLYLYPQEPSKFGKVDGMFNLDYENVTVTERNGVTIYGDGTPESTYRILEMVLEDGTYCQIVNRSAISPSADSLEAMGILVDHLLENGIDLEQIYPYNATYGS